MTTTQETLVSLNDQNSSDWEISEAELNSSRAIKPFDLRNVITDIQIYEHIENPYITGSVIFADAERVIERFDIQGAETFKLSLKRTKYSDKPVTKNFIVTSIQRVMRGNETTQLVELNITEDIGFKSALYNVNKAYADQPDKIIATIARYYFHK